MSATSCRWILQKRKFVNVSSSLKSWISNLFPHWMVLSSMPISIWLCTYATILGRSSIMEVETSLLTSDISDLVPLEPDTDNKAKKSCHCCCYCWCFLHSNWNPHHHCFHWQAHPVLQKHIWLHEYPAGTQGQSSIGEKTWCVDGLQRIHFWF